MFFCHSILFFFYIGKFKCREMTIWTIVMRSKRVNFGNIHHHSWPFAGIINFDEVMIALKEVGYRGYFNFEASYTLHHHRV